MAIPDFIAGLMYGLTTNNHLTEIETCYDSGVPIDMYVQTALDDFHHGGKDWDMQAIINIGLAGLNVPIALTTCRGMGDDLHAIESWATVFTHPEELTKDLTKNWLLHKKAIKADIHNFKADWAAGEYFKSGVDAADLLNTAIGPIKVQPTLSVMPSSFKVMEIPDFVAGFLYGWTGDNNLTEVEACWTSDLPIMEDLQKAGDELFHGHIIKGVELFEKAVFNLQIAMEPCHAMQDDLAALKAWSAMFKEPTKLLEVVGTHWELHKRGIKKDIATTKDDFAAGEYFKAGESTADAFTLLFGKVE